MSEQSRGSRLAEIRARLESISELYAPRGTARGFYVEQSIADINFLLDELDAASAAAADRMEESGCARLWLVAANPSWGKRLELVVAAGTEEEAVAIAKEAWQWSASANLEACALGWAMPGVRGVVVKGFKAG